MTEPYVVATDWGASDDASVQGAAATTTGDRAICRVDAHATYISRASVA